MLKLLNGYVYEVTKNKKLLKGNIDRIKISNARGELNKILDIQVTFQKFDEESKSYITDTSINKDVEIYVNDILQGTETILSGIGNIEFESAETGTFKITVENYSCEVIVNA